MQSGRPNLRTGKPNLARVSAGVRRRSGMVLILVLVVVLMLSFAVYSFSELMVAEYAATKTGLRQLQRRELATSGIELAALAIRQRETFVARPFEIRLPGNEQAMISVLRSIPSKSTQPIFGMSDESAKLNINTLPLEKSRRTEARQRLLVLPGMTLQIADAILDWRDPDDEVSEFGAETSYYAGQSSARLPRQAPFEDLNEILYVRGVNTDMLYGEDQNQNGLLDPEENDGDGRAPRDNRDGVLQQGWADLITVQSCESTLRSDGRPKINLNQPVLARLYDELEPEFGSEAATYIVAWRMRGATYLDAPRPDEGNDLERRRLERLESAMSRLNSQLGDVERESEKLTADQTRRGGLTLTESSAEFKSALDLFGGQVQVAINGVDTLLESPWSADPATARRMLPVFERSLTTTDEMVFQGRISINEAPESVLRSIPGMSESAARTIARIQPQIQSLNGSDEFRSVAWLVGRGILSLPELREMGPFITTGGDIRSGVCLGQIQGDAAVSSLRFRVDCSGSSRRILWLQDMPVMSSREAGIPEMPMMSKFP